MSQANRRPRIGIALGSGSARGWAHIGVLRALTEAGLKPDIVVGASVGAIVGAAFASGELDRFEQWVRSLTARAVWSFMDFGLGGGMLKGEKLAAFLRGHFADPSIDKLPLTFGAVATALESGDEVWLRDGLVADAVRASFALPGLFTPVWHDGRLLVDGGLVNPVPVSLARALGADHVIGVDLNADIAGHLLRPGEAPSRFAGWIEALQGRVSALLPGGTDTAEVASDAAADASRPQPGVLEVLFSSINVMQTRITRSRMAGDPPDVTITPRLGRFGLMDFHRAAEAIDVGRAAATEMLPQLRLRGLLPPALPDSPPSSQEVA